MSGFVLERTNDGAMWMPEQARAEQSGVNEDDDEVVKMGTTSRYMKGDTDEKITARDTKFP